MDSRQPGSVDSGQGRSQSNVTAFGSPLARGFARPAVEPFQQPVFAQMVDPARPSPNTKDWPQNVAYGSYPGPTGLPPNGPHANWQVDQRVPEHGQHAQGQLGIPKADTWYILISFWSLLVQLTWLGSGGEGMQVFHAAVQLMQKALVE